MCFIVDIFAPLSRNDVKIKINLHAILTGVLLCIKTDS